MTRIIPLVEENHVEGYEETVAGLAVLQGEHEFGLLLDRESAVAMLHPDVVAEHDKLPERLLVVELEVHLLTELAQPREIPDRRLDLGVQREHGDLRRQGIRPFPQRFSNRVDQHHADLVRLLDYAPQQAVVGDERVVSGEGQDEGVARGRKLPYESTFPPPRPPAGSGVARIHQGREPCGQDALSAVPGNLGQIEQQRED